MASLPLTALLLWNCPPTLLVSNCPRCPIFLVSNCPRISFDEWVKISKSCWICSGGYRPVDSTMHCSVEATDDKSEKNIQVSVQRVSPAKVKSSAQPSKAKWVGENYKQTTKNFINLSDLPADIAYSISPNLYLVSQNTIRTYIRKASEENIMNFPIKTFEHKYIKILYLLPFSLPLLEIHFMNGQANENHLWLL